MKLFELTQQYKELERLSETDDLPSEVIADTLDGIEGDFKDKAIAVAKMVLTLEADADAIAAAATAMNQRAERVERRAESLRAYLLFNLQALDIKRLETPEVVIARRTNPVAVQVTDEQSIPAQFWVQPEPPPKRIDKKALKAALQSGEPVSGAYLESGERLEVKL